MNTTPTQDTIEARYIAACQQSAKTYIAVGEAIEARRAADIAFDIALANDARAHAAVEAAREAVNVAQWRSILEAAQYASASASASV